MSCVIPYCRSCFKSANKSGEDRSFHRFPETHTERQKWIDAIGLNNWTPSRHHRICSKHFENDCFFVTCNKRVLLPNAIPTIFQRPLEASQQNRQSESKLNEMTLSGNDRLPDAIPTTVPPRPLQESHRDLPSPDYDKEIRICTTGSHLNQQLGGKNIKIVLSGNEKLLPRSLQVTCQECMSITRQYQEKLLKKDQEIKCLSSELEQMKKMLQRSNRDLERAKSVSKKRQLMVWRLKKRDQRSSMKKDNLK